MTTVQSKSSNLIDRRIKCLCRLFIQANLKAKTPSDLGIYFSSFYFYRLSILGSTTLSNRPVKYAAHRIPMPGILRPWVDDCFDWNVMSDSNFLTNTEYFCYSVFQKSGLS